MKGKLKVHLRALQVLIALLALSCALFEAPAPTPTAAPTPPPPTATHTPAPTATPTPQPTLLPPPPGLVYLLEREPWFVGEDGEPMRLPPGATPSPTPEGPRYYFAEGDLWVEDAGTATNLTRTPERDELAPLYEAPSGERLVLCSYAPAEVLGVGYRCALTSVRPDGTGYAVLTEELHAPPALSPDGETLAYLAPTGPETWDRRLWLLPLEGEPQAVDWGEYGFEGRKLTTHEVAWSPGGARLAGWAWGENEDGERFDGVLILDLAARDHRLLADLYHPPYPDGFPPAPEWSPDGRWLTFFGLAEEGSERYGLWVVSAGGDGRHLLAEFTANGAWGPLSLAWSPDGERLALTRHERDVERGVWIARAGEWVPRKADLPDAARVVGWR
jgi:dipeptidyl aminopeptidase/acylaminoacyl peptidase